jgi:hypothetical protein
MNLQEKFKLAIEETEKEGTPMIVCTIGELQDHFDKMVRSEKGFNKPNLRIGIYRGNMVVGTVQDLERIYAGRGLTATDE